MALSLVPGLAPGLVAGDWEGTARARLGEGPGRALAQLGAPGGRSPMLPLWPEGLPPGDPRWPEELVRALGEDLQLRGWEWVSPEFRPRLAAYFQEGSLVKAAKLTEEMLLRQGSNLRLHLLSAWLYEQVGRSDLARDRYRRAEELALTTGDRDLVRFSLLRTALRFGKGRALRHEVEGFERLLRVAGSQEGAEARERLAVAIGWRGLLALAEGHVQRAADLFREALGQDPNNLSLRFNLALAEYHSPLRVGHAGRSIGSLAGIERAVGSGHSGAVEVAARTLTQRMKSLQLRALAQGGAPDRALEEAEALQAATPRDTRVAQVLAEFYERMGKWEEAAARYAVIREHAPLARLRQQGATDEARALARVDELRAHQVSPEEVALSEAAMLVDQPTYREAARLLRRARRRIGQERFSEALRLFHEGWEQWPEVVQFPLERAQLLTRLGRYRQAQAELGRALEVDPDRGETHAWMALVLLARGPAGPGPARALGHADRAKAQEATALALHARGWALSALGDVRDGAEELRRAAELDPENPEIHYRLGLSLMALDLEASALPRFQEAARLSPAHPRASLMSGLALARMGRREEAIEALSLVAQGARSNEQRIARNTLARLTGQARADNPSDRPDLAVPPPGLPAPGADLATTSSELAETRSPGFSRYLAAADRVRRGELQAAKDELAALQEEFPGFAEPSVARATLTLLDGESDAARESVNTILDLRPDDPRGLVLWAAHAVGEGEALALARALGAYARTPGEVADDRFLQAVIRRWDEVLEIDPYRTRARWHRGMLRLFSGSLVAADKDFTGAGEDPPALRGRALVSLLRFARTKDGMHLKDARGFLRQSGDGVLVRGLERVRQEVLREDEVEARPVALERTWDRATATEYVCVSPQVKSMVLGLPVDSIDATRAGLGQRPWQFIDGLLRAKGTSGAGEEPEARARSGPLDYQVLTGEKPGEIAVPAPGIRSGSPFDLPGESVFEEGLFGELGELPDAPPELPDLDELPPEEVDLPEIGLDEDDLGDLGGGPTQGEIDEPIDFDELGDLDDLDDLGDLDGANLLVGHPSQGARSLWPEDFPVGAAPTTDREEAPQVVSPSARSAPPVPSAPSAPGTRIPAESPPANVAAPALSAPETRIAAESPPADVAAPAQPVPETRILAESPPPVADAPALPVPEPETTVERAPPGGPEALRAALAPLSGGRVDQAEQALRRILSDHPDWEAPVRDLALLLLETGRTREALELTRRSSRRFGKGRFWYRLGAWLAHGRGEGERARRLRARAAVSPRRITASAYPEVAGRAWKWARERGGGAEADWHLALLDFYGFRDEAARERLRDLGERAEALELVRFLDGPGEG